VGTWHDPDLGRPIAAPLERCAELLGIDLATVHALAANVEPYIRADGTRIWSLMQLERQLRPEAYGRAGAATWSADRPGSPTYSQSGMPQALLGYESFEHRSEVFIWLRPGPSTWVLASSPLVVVPRCSCWCRMVS
jgi:hypothetical protein